MITARGRWNVPLFEIEPQWDLNYSSILSELIQLAGRYCESYASDLFIIWKYCVDNKLKDYNLESFTLRFGFREMGVDHELSNDPDRQTVTKNKENNSYYYRKIVTLEINRNGNDIEMILK